MSKRSFLIGLFSAAGAFGITLAVLSPGDLNAQDPMSRRMMPVPAGILTPMQVQGAEVKLEFIAENQPVQAPELNPGESPRARLVIQNSADESTELKASITVREQGLRSPLARSMPRPTNLSSSEENIVLAPGEKRVIEIAPGIKTKPGTSIQIAVSFDKTHSRMLSFVIPSQLEKQMQAEGQNRKVGQLQAAGVSTGEQVIRAAQ